MWGNNKNKSRDLDKPVNPFDEVNNNRRSGKISNDAIKDAIEAAKNSSSKAWNRQFAESEQQIKDKHLQKRLNTMEGDSGGKSLGNSKWTSSCDGIVPQ